MDFEAQRRFDHSVYVGSLASEYLRFAADEARKSLEEEARKAGLSYDKYIFYLLHPNLTRPNPPPPPTRAQVHTAFFELSGWTQG